MSEWEKLNLDESIIKEFLEESLTGLDALRPKLFHLEQEGPEGINAVFRWVHTVKGTSGFLNLTVLQSFAHKFETFLQQVKSKTVALTHEVASLTTEGVDLIQDALDNLRNRNIQLSPEHDDFLNRLSRHGTEGSEDDIDHLTQVVSRLSEKKIHFLKKGTPTEIKSAISLLEKILKQIEEVDVMPTVASKMVLLKSVVLPDGQNLTELVKEVLVGVEQITVAGSNADSLKSKTLPEIVDKIHDALFPEEKTRRFEWSTVVDVYEIMPQVLDNFWKKFWIESIEVHAKVAYFHAEELASMRESETHAKKTEEKQKTEIEEKSKETAEESQQETEASKTEETIRIGSHYLDQFTRRAEALVMNRNYLENLEREIRGHLSLEMSKELGNGLIDLETNIGELQNALFTIRSSYLRELFERLPRMLRQLERDLGKTVNLKIRGEDIEVDRSVIGILADPLVHMIRNAVDHGLESPQERKKLGKPEAGTVKVIATKSEEWLTLKIRDDGKGIDPEKIMAKAKERGLVQEDREYTNEDCYQFLLEPGFSTAEKVTNVSGRGVGMDVVASTMRKQGGNIKIESELGKGSTFILTMPIKTGTLTKEILLIEVDDRRYAISQDCLREVLKVDSVSLRQDRSSSMLCHRDNLINIINLSEVLHANYEGRKEKLKGRLLLLEDEQKQMVAVRVDRTLEQLQVVIKPFDHEFLKGNALFAGTVVIGLGQPVLVLSLKDASALQDHHNENAYE